MLQLSDLLTGVLGEAPRILSSDVSVATKVALATVPEDCTADQSQGAVCVPLLRLSELLSRAKRDPDKSILKIVLNIYFSHLKNYIYVYIHMTRGAIT